MSHTTILWNTEHTRHHDNYNVALKSGPCDGTFDGTGLAWRQVIATTALQEEQIL